MPGSLSSLKLAIFAPLFAAFALLFVLSHPAAAQISFKPTAEAVQEDKLLNALKEGDKISGRVSIPDRMASSLIQPAGRDWRDFHRSKLPWIGGVSILGMLALLAIFMMVRGRIRLQRGFSGRTILRFASFERFTHWLTASCFIILALSGLNVSFGRTLILPLFGPEAFASMSAWAKLAHNYLAFPLSCS
jgi:formate dehydrogenase subunit gamma